jgi:hypothetical protein
MTLALANLADLLRIESVVFDIRRNDELSGSGDGRLWQAELAPPLWTADIALQPAYHADAEDVATVLRSLNGSQEPFMLYSPTRRFPRADPTGALLGAYNPLISSIAPDRRNIALKFLPAGYVLMRGDKLQIVFGERNQFLEIVDEVVTANGAGVTPSFRVFPHVRIGVGVDQAALLKNPACKMILQPGTHNPGRAQAVITMGATFKAIEKK